MGSVCPLHAGRFGLRNCQTPVRLPPSQTRMEVVLVSETQGLPVNPELEQMSLRLEAALETRSIDDVLRICTRAKAWLADKDAEHIEWGYWAGVVKWAEEAHRFSPLSHVLKEQRQTFLAEWRIVRNPEHY
jgi:hypothetical protein